MLLVVALASGLLAGSATASPSDSTSIRVEIGAAVEVSNEQFYESSIDDTTFLGRRLLDAPETRFAAVLLADLLRTFGAERWQFRFSPDASIGEQAIRAAASASLRGHVGDRTRIALEPRAEYRRDEGFGMPRRDWRASLVARLRRLDIDELGALRFSAGSEVVRSLEGADAFVLSGRSARATLGYSRSPLFGPEWDAEYGVVARTYRDSTDRDHVEHRVLVSLRGGAGRAREFSLSAGGERRLAIHEVQGSRDRFTRFDVEAGAALSLGTEWSLRPVAMAEWLRHDDPDSVLDFDYQLARAHLVLRREVGPAWRAGAGARCEWLAAPWNTAEEYSEVAALLEVERFSGSSLLSVSPAAGRRTYGSATSSAVSGGLLAPVLHSTFDFAELTGFLDQPLPARLRLRLTGALRSERHTDPAHDARSLYFSFDVRTLF